MKLVNYYRLNFINKSLIAVRYIGIFTVSLLATKVQKNKKKNRHLLAKNGLINFHKIDIKKKLEKSDIK